MYYSALYETNLHHREYDPAVNNAHYWKSDLKHNFKWKKPLYFCSAFIPTVAKEK